MDYKLIICGGTFDRLHKGHKAFLRFAFAHGEKVIIGLTSDAYVALHKKDGNILSYAEREKEIKQFLLKEGFLDRVTIVAIDSKFDRTQIPESDSVALLVTIDTASSASEINAVRKKEGLRPLHVLQMELVPSEGDSKLSSSAIREGMLDREGKLLPSKEFLSQRLFLPEDLRDILREPFGNVFPSTIPNEFLANPEKLVTVGDATTKKFNDLKTGQALSVVDFQVERHHLYDQLSDIGFIGDEELLSAKNPAGQLAPDVWRVLLSAVEKMKKGKRVIVQIDGEEDLLAIPLILMLPLRYNLAYGQRNEGIIIAEITEELKRKTYEILKLFVAK